jgi:cytochrome c oxidase assembly protein subunit 15
VWTACGLVVASYLQLVAGAQLRHLDAAVGPVTFRWLVALHLAGAAAVVTLSLLSLARFRGGPSPAARRWAVALALLVGGQVVLGCLAWVASWGVPSAMLPESWVPAEPVVARGVWAASVVTGHVVLGMLILGGSVALAIAAGALDEAAVDAASSRSAAGRPAGGVFA